MIDNLIDLYKIIDNLPLAEDSFDELTRTCVALKQKLQTLQDTESADMAFWEANCFVLINQHGQLKFPIISSGDENIFADYSQDQHSYVKNRLTATTNLRSKARYAHFLWASPQKHTDFAKEASQAYLELATYCEQQDAQSQSSGHLSLTVYNHAITAISLAESVPDKAILESAKSFLHTLLTTFNLERTGAFVSRIEIIREILSHRKLFSSLSFDGLAQLCADMMLKCISTGNEHGALEISHVGMAVDARTQSTTANWRDLQAQTYERLALQTRGLVALGWCEKALIAYRGLNEEEKVKSLTDLYTELRSKQIFSKIPLSTDLTPFLAGIPQRAEALLKDRSPHEILEILSLHEDLLPTMSSVKDLAQTMSAGSIFYDHIPVTVYDPLGNPAHHYHEPEEREAFQQLEAFRIIYENFRSPFIYQVFLTAIKDKNLSAENFASFLRERTWYATSVPRRLPNGNTVFQNWLPQLVPAIRECFDQIMVFEMTILQPNFVLAIDSLSVKIEGLLRDLLTINGTKTIKIVRDNKGRSVVREAYIDDLLREPALSAILSEDEILFIKYLLVEKFGHNLRNKVSHALMLNQEYGAGLMFALLLTVLRLGKFSLESAPPTSDN